MASFRKRGKTWTATIDRVGFKPEHSTFPSKGMAEAWARKRESELLAGKRGQIVPHTAKEALEKYSKEVAPSHRGARWEQIRLAKMVRELPFAGRLLSEVTAADIAAWRDLALAGREKQAPLAPASVRREMVILRLVLETARKEWGWLSVNPITEVGWPSAGRPRERRVPEDEVERILLALNYERGTTATLMTQRVAVAFLWALETAMRAGEIVGLTWDDVNVEGRYASLPRTKNGDGRKVPLSKAAIALLDDLPTDGQHIFNISSTSLDVLFRRARARAGATGLHFHDSRAEALTRLSKKVDVLTLARIAGHRDVRSLMVYYRETATEIAARLD